MSLAILDLPAALGPVTPREEPAGKLKLAPLTDAARNTLTGPPNFNDDFHVFAVEWENGEIRWYVDGILYASRDSWFSTGGSFPAPFDVDFHLLLNLAVGGNLPGPPDASTVFPQEYVIDYVRVYQQPNAAPVVEITSPMDSDAINPGDDLTITVSATDADGTIESVEFFQGAYKLGEDDTAPYEITVPGVAVLPTELPEGSSGRLVLFSAPRQQACRPRPCVR